MCCPPENMHACKAIEDKDRRIANLEGELSVAREQLAWLKKQVFGAKSERIIADLKQQPLLAGLDLGEPKVFEPKQEEISYRRAKSAKNRGADTISFPDDLPVKRVELDLPCDQKICPETGLPLVCIGSEVSRKLGRTPESFFIVEYVRFKYASKARPELGVSTATLPDAIIPRCPADESLLASVLVAKYADHLPLNRLAEIFARSGVKISRQTLSKWVLTLGAALSPLYDELGRQILQSGQVFADETPILMQIDDKGRCQTAYMWTYVGGGGADPPYRYYQFRTNRNHEHALATLKGYQGLLHSDKYGVYEVLAQKDGIVWCPCMAHVRRKFVEAEGGDPVFRRNVLRRIRYLFMLERAAWKRTPEERLRIREKIEKPLLERLTRIIKERAMAGGLLPKSNLAKAINYYLGLEPYLGNYLAHPDARMDNNVAERAVRPLAVGRKNWLFVGSEDGGRAAATILSLVQTCRNLGINPQDYLEDVMRRVMSHPARFVHQLLPNNWLAARQITAE
jgi:transposase